MIIFKTRFKAYKLQDIIIGTQQDIEFGEVGLGKYFSPWQGMRYTGDIDGEVKSRVTTLSWNEDGFLPLRHRLCCDKWQDRPVTITGNYYRSFRSSAHPNDSATIEG